MMERDVPNSAQDMPMGVVGWLEPLVMDVAMELAIAPGVALDYMAWWKNMHLGSLGLDASNSKSDSASSPPSEED